jgi:four helix bundle protein
MEQERIYDLEERLINFAVEVIAVCDTIKPTKAGNHLAGQLVRSGTSPALNYGEAQAGESPRDFLHKLKIILKELRESRNCLRIIKKANLFSGKPEHLQIALNECTELVAIFTASVKTAQRNQQKN